MSYCETCNTEFACGRLAAALKVTEATPDLDTKPELKRAAEQLRGLLRDANWRYPDGEARCALEGRTEEIRRLTEVLIAALAHPHDQDPTTNPRRSLLDEEYRRD